eukprot:4168636-Pleurochrysis_carterae.AAC.1
MLVETAEFLSLMCNVRDVQTGSLCLWPRLKYLRYCSYRSLYSQRSDLRIAFAMSFSHAPCPWRLAVGIGNEMRRARGLLNVKPIT